MTYSNVPLSGQYLGNTRQAINTNFSLIQTTISQDHQPIGSSGQGKHRVCHFPKRSSDSSTLANEIAAYCIADPNSPNEPNLFLREQNSGFVYQLTKMYSAKSSTFGKLSTYTYSGKPGSSTASGGWTFLPGGLIMQYGTLTSPGASGTLLFPFAFPSGNAPYFIQLTIATASSSTNRSACLDSGTAPTKDGFTYLIQGSTVTLNWMAVGL